MIDIRLLRNDPISVKQSISRRGESTADLDLIIGLDEKYRKTAETETSYAMKLKNFQEK